MRPPTLLLLLLAFLSVAYQTEAFHRINLIRQSNHHTSNSFENLANRLKLDGLRTNMISNHLATENIPLNLTDGWFWAEITIGTPPQTFKVSFETFSSFAYVPSVNCTEITCTIHNRYNSSQSKTFEEDGRFVHIDHLREGYLAKDKLCIGGICAKSQGFVELTKDYFIYDNGKVDGFIGLAFPDNSSQEVSPFFETLFDQGEISSPIIGLYMNITAPNNTFGGELSVGGVDPDRFYAPINWVPMHHFETKSPWRFNLDKILVNDIPVTCFDGCTAVLNYLGGFAGPTKQIDALFPELIKQSGFGITAYLLVDCTKERIAALPVLSFVIGGEKYELRGEEYTLDDNESGVCMLGIIGENYDTDGRWYIGESFTKKYYTAYDYKQKRIGLAKARN